MKKLLCLLLVCAAMLNLCACGNQTGNEPTLDHNAPSNTSTETPTEAPTGAPTEAPTECPHSYEEAVTVEATCTAAGELRYTCSACGESYTEEIPMIAHTYAEATCSDPKRCTCGATEGAALGHEYTNGKCTRCNEADPSYSALTDGNWCYYVPSGEDLNYGVLSFQNGTFSYVNDSAFNINILTPQQQEEIRKEESHRLIAFNGETYVAPRGVWVLSGSYTDNGDGTITLSCDEPFVCGATLQRISANQLKVIANNELISVDTVLTSE